MFFINRYVVAVSSSRYLVWFVGVSFVLFQFFLQLSSGVIIGAITQEIGLTSLALGILSSAFYYVYTGMQMPVGVLFDRGNPRFLLVINALLCSLGCFFFAFSQHLFCLIIARIVMGAGASFAFVGLAHILRSHFPMRQFAFMFGLSETLGFLATMVAMISMGAVIEQYGWRQVIYGAGIIGLLITFLLWQFIPTAALSTTGAQNEKQWLNIFRNGTLWLNGLFIGLSFTIITVFGAMWAVPFIQVKLACSLNVAGFIDAMLFLGAAFSCPLFGYLGSHVARRKLLISISCFTTTVLTAGVIYLPITDPNYLGILMFLLGISCGAYMLAFSISNELAPAQQLSAATGFTNTLSMITAPIFQPIIGFLLDYLIKFAGLSVLMSYQLALLLIPINLAVAGILVYFLPEKKLTTVSK